MKFEEALSAMRQGKKIRHPHMFDDEYYMGCYLGINNKLFGFPDEKIEEIKSKYMSIVWMKSDKEHPDMRPKWNMHDPKTDPCKHGMMPMINLLWLISDDWEVVE